MPKFSVAIEFTRYSRGYEVYEVEAETEEQAKDDYWSGELIDQHASRDDWDREVSEITLIKEEV